MTSQIPEGIKRLLDSTMAMELVAELNVGDATYYLIDQYDDEAGEPVIVRQVEGAEPEVVDDIKADDDASGGAASDFPPEVQERLQAMRGMEERESDVPSGGAGLLGQAELNDRLRDQAERSAGEGPERLKSGDAPGTNGGKLACAWAVNRVAELALYAQIGGGLATANMITVLKSKHRRLGAPAPGCIVISPTENRPGGGRNIGHVGIVGKVGSRPEDVMIYSNSSRRARWERNFDQQSWVRRYQTDKGLAVFYFELDPGRFPGAGS